MDYESANWRAANGTGKKQNVTLTNREWASSEQKLDTSAGCCRKLDGNFAKQTKYRESEKNYIGNQTILFEVFAVQMQMFTVCENLK